MDTLRKFHCLAFDSSRDDLASIIDYELGDFDPTGFWIGEPVSALIPLAVKLYSEFSKKNPADYVGNPVSWPICSDRLVSLIKAKASNDVEFFKAPLFEKETGDQISGYWVMNVLRTVACLDVEESNIVYEPDGSTITGVFEYALKPDFVPDDVHVFRLKEWNYAIFVSDELAQTFVGKGLKGIALIRTRSVR